ncbi:MAG: zinc-dependent alcohol dehydrogenase, partial [Halodesulfurarchaeum sp.]
METRVAYLDIGEITLDTVELPELGPNDVLVKTHQASVCGSERYFYQGITVRPKDKARGLPTEAGDYHRDGEKHRYPMGPLGHEGGGTIEEVGSAVDTYLGGGDVSVGDRVGSLYFPTYTDYWVTDVSNVQPIPDGVSFEVGSLYEALGCATWAARNMNVKLGDTVAVNGVGFAGNIMLQGAIEAGASQVIAVDVVEKKLDIAESLGADVTINASDEDPVERVDELTDYEGVDVAVEAVGGTGIGMKQALGMVAHNGVLALYGDNYAPVDEFCFHRFHEDALEVQNLAPVHHTQLQSVENMREGMRTVERGVFDVDVILDNSDR